MPPGELPFQETRVAPRPDTGSKPQDIAVSFTRDIILLVPIQLLCMRIIFTLPTESYLY